MGVLLIKWPHTGRPISTGIELDPQSFAKLPDTLSLSKCPECGLDHAWWTPKRGWRSVASWFCLTKTQHNGTDSGRPHVWLR
jgi:hypothetical protein